MLNFHEYKILHFISIFIFITLFSIDLFVEGKNKWRRAIMMLASAIILLSGMGLLARLGFMTSAGAWPTWSIVKLIIWGILSVGAPLAAKRLKSFRNIVYFALIFFLSIAVFTIVVKPI